MTASDPKSAPPAPAVSVVIATRDRPELLRRAIAAVLSQEYPGPIDIAVVFDQTEPDQSLVQSTEGRAVSVMSNTHSPGLPGARNTGIEATNGELIAFCDDDDEWMQGKLAAQVRAFDRPDVTFCTTGIVIDFDGTRTDRPSQVSELTVVDLVHDRLTEAHPSSFVFRRAILDRIGLVDEVIPGGYSEDYDFLIRAARDGRIVCLPTPLVVIKWGRTSYFATRWRMIVDAQRYLMDKHPEFGMHRRAEARIRGQIAFALAALGERKAALREIGRTIARWPLEKRWPVALLVTMRVVSADRALALAHKTGRGI
ncbi:MAG: glycosyltransferase family 2 protein [Ilumatobacteraceae bacterium]